MANDRKLDRVKAMLGARIVFNNGNSTIDCLIRNISRIGAKLALSSSVSLPEEFDIDVPQKGKVYRARLCWREADAAGIEFVLDASETVRGGGSRVAELETENAALKLRLLELSNRLETALAEVERARSADRAA